MDETVGVLSWACVESESTVEPVQAVQAVQAIATVQAASVGT